MSEKILTRDTTLKSYLGTRNALSQITDIGNMSGFVRYWRETGDWMLITRDRLNTIEKTNPNPVLGFFTYLATTDKTIGDLIDALSQSSPNTISGLGWKNLLISSQKHFPPIMNVTRDTPANQVLIYDNQFDMLGKSVGTDWKLVAGELGYRIVDTQAFEMQQPPGNPLAHVIDDWIRNSRNTIGQFVLSLNRTNGVALRNVGLLPLTDHFGSINVPSQNNIFKPFSNPLVEPQMSNISRLTYEQRYEPVTSIPPVSRVQPPPPPVTRVQPPPAPSPVSQASSSKMDIAGSKDKITIKFNADTPADEVIITKDQLFEIISGYRNDLNSIARHLNNGYIEIRNSVEFEKLLVKWLSNKNNKIGKLANILGYYNPGLLAKLGLYNLDYFNLRELTIDVSTGQAEVPAPTPYIPAPAPVPVPAPYIPAPAPAPQVVRSSGPTSEQLAFYFITKPQQLEVFSSLGNDWKALAGELGFTNSDVQSFAAYGPEASIKMISKWLNKGLTNGELTKALLKIDRMDIIERLGLKRISEQFPTPAVAVDIDYNGPAYYFLNNIPRRRILKNLSAGDPYFGGWIDFGGKLGYDVYKLRSFSVHSNPADELIEDWIRNIDNTVIKLATALKSIGRLDIIQALNLSALADTIRVSNDHVRLKFEESLDKPLAYVLTTVDELKILLRLDRGDDWQILAQQSDLDPRQFYDQKHPTADIIDRLHNTMKKTSFFLKALLAASPDIYQEYVDYKFRN